MILIQEDSLNLFEFTASCKEIHIALQKLSSLTLITPLIQKALDFAIGAHKEQCRKRGEPYVVHPICVACIVAYYGGDEAMICSSLLHDVVEDTHFSIDEVRVEFGDEVAQIVDALTKIVELREENIPRSITNAKILTQALSFRKVLLASIHDVRAIFIKICDRLHNMLTLEALSEHKQKKIAEETLVVYAPIAYRLGISSIKNALEDQSFYYLFREEYQKIQVFLGENHLILERKLAEFVAKIRDLFVQEGMCSEDFEIQSRLKRPYSIYLKMQRKGIDIDEILDLLAIRVLLKDNIDCYKALGIIHLHFKPIVSRLKDYIAIPKENGYQTIHTTVFDKQSIFEVQIRTFEMQQKAEFGLAAHWKYKIGNQISLDWLNKIEYKDQDIDEFYELVKHDLYRDDIAVFSPMGDVFSLPAGSVVLDFAYAVHTELGENANKAYVNHQKVSLLEPLKNGDIVRIVTGEKQGMRCSWINLVKTSKAKNKIRMNCQNKLKEVNYRMMLQILKTLFSKTTKQIHEALEQKAMSCHLSLMEREFREDVERFREFFGKRRTFLGKIWRSKWELKEFEFENLKILSDKSIDGVLYDYCCCPKQGDEVMGILEKQKVIVHHRLCEKVKIIDSTKMVFVDWVDQIRSKYKIIVILEDVKGSLAHFLLDLAKYGCNLFGIFYKGYQDQFLTHFEVDFEIDSKRIKEFKNTITSKYKIVEFQNLKDAYQ